MDNITFHFKNNLYSFFLHISKLLQLNWSGAVGDGLVGLGLKDSNHFYSWLNNLYYVGLFILQSNLQDGFTWFIVSIAFAITLSHYYTITPSHYHTIRHYHTISLFLYHYHTISVTISLSHYIRHYISHYHYITLNHTISHYSLSLSIAFWCWLTRQH